MEVLALLDKVCILAAMDSKSVAGSVAGIASQLTIPADHKKALRMLGKLVAGEEVIYCSEKVYFSNGRGQFAFGASWGVVSNKIKQNVSHKGVT